MKIISIIGARPQFIKLAPLSKEIRKYHTEIIVHTGQHYDTELSKLFFDELNLPFPDYNLNIGSHTHAKQTGLMMIEIEKVLLKEKPDLVIVIGDTNSTLAGALASSKLNIKIAHVEAGMRNFDREKPEETNRILTDHISNYLFSPTKTAVTNLENEGIVENVYLVGDTTKDALNDFIKLAEIKSNIETKLNIKSKKYILLTIHKSKNTDNYDRLNEIINAISEIDEQIVFPMHPRTKKFLEKNNQIKIFEKNNIIITKPLGYLDFIKLEKNAKKIITDSGGVQKEAYIFKVPCITLRETEWIETVKDGWNKIIKPDKKAIIQAIKNFKPKNKQTNFLGEGNASKKIVEILINVSRIKKHYTSQPVEYGESQFLKI